MRGPHAPQRRRALHRNHSHPRRLGSRSQKGSSQVRLEGEVTHAHEPTPCSMPNPLTKRCVALSSLGTTGLGGAVEGPDHAPNCPPFQVESVGTTVERNPERVG